MCLSSPPNYQVGDTIYRPTKFNSPGWAGGGRAAGGRVASWRADGGRVVWATGSDSRDGQAVGRVGGGRARL